MKLNEQRQWYEEWHTSGESTLAVEWLKQTMRLTSINQCLATLQTKEMLVIGCGSGHELKLITSDTLVALDLSHVAVKSAQKHVPGGLYIQSSGMELPFPDQSFDTILTSEVIEHILEPELMMQEIVRILQPGGSIIISTPNWMSFFGLARKLGETILRRPITSDGQPVDNWSTPQSLKGLIVSSGLSITSRRGAWYFPPTGLRGHGLPDNLMAPIFKSLLPFEKWLQTKLPGLGHLLVIVASKPSNNIS